MAESEQALQLKRRARRRLVGAVALVTFVVIILPLILDKEPGTAGPPLSVQIPSQESGALNKPLVPAAPMNPAVPAPAPEKQAEIPPVKAETSAVNAVTPPVKAEPAAAQEPPPAQAVDKSEEARAKAALGDLAWVIMLDAFSDAKNVKQLRAKLTAAGVKSYTEPVKTAKGELTRVRAGPFSSKETAEKARAKLEAMGLKPGAVASR